ncbi:hypothetical protein BDF19DRAFT_420334 [Syncephalis fuscata]|nr:hypothetical protein BDF19DRAFT_420334 [Syncephalis fuscata]
MGTITNHQGEAFLLRATEEAAIVFNRTLHHANTITTLKWSVWEFSNRYLGYGPRCLMQGEIRFKTFDDFRILVKKLDDNRILIEHNSPFNIGMLSEGREDEVRLAMISTECGYSDTCIKNVNPVWTRNDYLYGTIPLFGSNRIIFISERGWAVHSLVDGAILARTSVKTLNSALKASAVTDDKKLAHEKKSHLIGIPMVGVPAVAALF